MEPKHNKKSVAGIMKESKSTLQSLYNITNHMSPTPIGHFLSTYIRFIFFAAVVLTARACYKETNANSTFIEGNCDSENIIVTWVGALSISELLKDL